MYLPQWIYTAYITNRKRLSTNKTNKAVPVFRKIPRCFLVIYTFVAYLFQGTVLGNFLHITLQSGSDYTNIKSAPWENVPFPLPINQILPLRKFEVPSEKEQ